MIDSVGGSIERSFPSAYLRPMLRGLTFDVSPDVDTSIETLVAEAIKGEVPGAGWTCGATLQNVRLSLSWDKVVVAE